MSSLTIIPKKCQFTFSAGWNIMEREELMSKTGRPGSLKNVWSGKKKKPNFQLLLEIAHPGTQRQYTCWAIADVCQIQPWTDFRFWAGSVSSSKWNATQQCNSQDDKGIEGMATAKQSNHRGKKPKSFLMQLPTSKADWIRYVRSSNILNLSDSKTSYCFFHFYNLPPWATFSLY